MSSAPCSVLRKPDPGSTPNRHRHVPRLPAFAVSRCRHCPQAAPAALRYWNRGRQRYCRSLVRYCSGLRVSADRAADRAAHTRTKPAVLDLQRPGLCETRTLRWRNTDSNPWSRSCERLFWALPIGDGDTNGGATYRSRSEAAMLAGVVPHSLSFRGGTASSNPASSSKQSVSR